MDLSEASNLKKKLLDKQTWENLRPQTKIITMLVIPLFLGSLAYTICIGLSSTPSTAISYPDELANLSMMIFMCFIFFIGSAFLLYYFTKVSSTREKMAMTLAFFVGWGMWVYYMYVHYSSLIAALNAGKNIFICSTSNSPCVTDNTTGPYSGIKHYVYRNKDVKDYKIPANLLNISNTNEMTLMFWLKIDYGLWKTFRFRGKNKIILMKGNAIESSDIVVWALPNVNSIQFDVNTMSGKPISLYTQFIFDKWVNYAIIINKQVIEMYKNAALEQSSVLNNHQQIRFTKSPMYIGRSPLEDKKPPAYDKFPGQLLYILYQNNSMVPEQLHKEYKLQYSIISNMQLSLNNIFTRPEDSDDSKCCLDRCEEKENKMMEFDDLENETKTIS